MSFIENCTEGGKEWLSGGRMVVSVSRVHPRGRGTAWELRLSLPSIAREQVTSSGKDQNSKYGF